MQAHEDQFEEHLFRRMRPSAMDLPEDGKLSKVRNGQIGSVKISLPEHINNELNDIWQNEMTPTTGLNSYEDLRKDIDELMFQLSQRSDDSSPQTRYFPGVCPDTFLQSVIV